MCFKLLWLTNCFDTTRLWHLQVTCSPKCFTWLWPTDCLMQQEYGTEHSSPMGVGESVQLKYLLAFQSRKPSLSLLTPQQPSWKVKRIAFMYNYHVIQGPRHCIHVHLSWSVRSDTAFMYNCHVLYGQRHCIYVHLSCSIRSDTAVMYNCHVLYGQRRCIHVQLSQSTRTEILRSCRSVMFYKVRDVAVMYKCHVLQGQRCCSHVQMPCPARSEMLQSCTNAMFYKVREVAVMYNCHFLFHLNCRDKMKWKCQEMSHTPCHHVPQPHSSLALWHKHPFKDKFPWKSIKKCTQTLICKTHRRSEGKWCHWRKDISTIINNALHTQLW